MKKLILAASMALVMSHGVFAAEKKEPTLSNTDLYMLTAIEGDGTLWRDIPLDTDPVAARVRITPADTAGFWECWTDVHGNYRCES